MCPGISIENPLESQRRYESFSNSDYIGSRLGADRAWCPRGPLVTNRHWMTLDLLTKMHVSGLAMQTRNDATHHHVKTFDVSISDDGVTYVSVGVYEVFGLLDRTLTAHVLLAAIVETRFIKITSKTWSNEPCFRIGIILSCLCPGHLIGPAGGPCTTCPPGTSKFNSDTCLCPAHLTGPAGGPCTDCPPNTSKFTFDQSVCNPYKCPSRAVSLANNSTNAAYQCGIGNYEETRVLNPPRQQRNYSSVLSNSFLGSLLDDVGAGSTWQPSSNSIGQWMDIDAGEPMDIVGLITQGKGGTNIEFVRTFIVEYSDLAWKKCQVTKHWMRMYCERNTPQHTATHCYTLQYSAIHCNTLQHTATHYITLQHTATHCNRRSLELQRPSQDIHCNTLQHTPTHCNTLQHTATGAVLKSKGQVKTFTATN